jgi:hypothetical protein
LTVLGAPSRNLTRLSDRHDWIVCAWFTDDPVYRPLAERLAASLDTIGAPYDLASVDRLSGGWEANFINKPAQLLAAVDRHPAKTVVFLDVDCILRGDIAPVANITGDVGITVIARGHERPRHWWPTGRSRGGIAISVECSSRVLVLRPTAGARAFVETWKRRLEGSAVKHDEYNMVWAFLASPGVAFSYIDQRYSGREVSQLPDAVIGHDSAHEMQRRRQRRGLREMLKALERPFRRGRAGARRLGHEMAVIQESQERRTG